MTNSIYFFIEKIKENKFSAFIQMILILWIFSIPLKNALYQLTTVILIILFFIHFLYCKQKEQFKELWITYKQLFILFITFTVAMTLSSILGISNYKAFSEILKYIYRYPLILFILFYFYKQSIFNRKWFLSVIFITLFIHALDGVYQYITGIDFIKHNNLYHNICITGAVFNRNPFGLIMAIGSILSSVLLLNLKNYLNNRYDKFIYIISFLLFLFTLFHSQSRSAWVMFGFFFLGYIWIYLKEYGMNKKLLILLFLMIFFISILFMTDINLHHRLQLLLEGYGSGRTEIWQFILEQIKENPMLGYGIDTFKTLVANTDLSQYAGTHNIFLELLLFTGIIGFSIFFYLIFITLKESFAKEKILYGLFFLSYLLLLQVDGSLIRGKIHLSVFIIALFFIYSFRLDRKRSSASE